MQAFKTILLLIILVSLLATSLLQAQKMEITAASGSLFSPEKLVRDVLLGTGVEVLDVKFKGDPSAVGYFTKGKEVIGIERGILLTTGKAVESDCKNGIAGADCVGIDVASNDNQSDATDKDLERIVSSNLEDAAVIVITFIPKSEIVRFNYVFASEEYPEWSCTDFNDVFGFFISGPNINGSFENNGINIARIPGTNLSVSINSVHPANPGYCEARFEEYYHNNTTSTEQPVYDGFLSVFTAEATVIPCQTYTIKLVIADVSDSFWDSAVFLEAKSFSTTSIDAIFTTASRDEVIIEGCKPAQITFHLPSISDEDFQVQYKFIGNAVKGLDFKYYPEIPTVKTGQNHTSMEIIPLEDGIRENIDSIGLEYQAGSCIKDTVWLYIKDNSLTAEIISADTSVCEGQSVQLSSQVSLKSDKEYLFTNKNSQPISHDKTTTSSIQVENVRPGNLGPGVIRSVCLSIKHSSAEDLDIYLVSPDGHFLELSTDNGETCDNYTNVCFSPDSLKNSISNSHLVPSCSSGTETQFSNQIVGAEGVWSDLWFGKFRVNGEWKLLINDDNPGENGTLLEWSITFEPYYTVKTQWTPAENLSCSNCPNPTTIPSDNSTFGLQINDSFGCEVRDSMEVEVIKHGITPQITCSEIADSLLTFDWTLVPGATAYVLKSNGLELLTIKDTIQFAYTFTGLKQGDSRTLEVHPITNCGTPSVSLTCSIPKCDLPELELVSVKIPSCPGKHDAEMQVIAKGGAGDYSYRTNSIVNSSGKFFNLNSGVQVVSVTDKAGCTSGRKFEIQSPEALHLAFQTTPFGCEKSGGEAIITASGGNLPYRYEWSNGSKLKDIKNAVAGIYSVTVTDAGNCTVESAIEIGRSDSISISFEKTEIDCPGALSGAIKTLATGGAGNLSFSWTGPNGFHSDEKDLKAIGAGSYSLKVSDSVGCTKIMTLGIGELLLPLDIILNRPDEICFGTRNGTLDAQAFGGTAPYKYYWSNGMTGSTINKLPAGTYTVTVIDSKSCFQINQVTVSEGKPMTIQVGHTLPSCHNGSDAKAWVEKVSVDTTVLDQSQITYQWSILNQITPVVSSLRAGTTYYVTVTNSKGCSSTASLTIGNPLPLKAEIITAINPKCTNGNSGTLSAATTGGLPPYSYNWGANTNYQEGDMAKGLAAGSYAVTVTDSLTCTTVASGKLTDPPPIKTYLEKTAVRCFGGSDGASTAVAEGGISPYRYIWSNGIMGNKLTNVVSADYQVTVTDAAGCTHISQVFIPQPEPLALATAFASPATCFGLKNGRIQAEGKGGIPPYSFSLEGKNFSSSSIFISLGAGTYKVFMRDKNSCDYISPEVQVAEPQLFTVDIGQDTLVAPGNSIRIVPEISGRDSNSVSFFWQSTNPLSRIADPTWKNAEFHLMGSTIASLEASDSNGCKATDQKYIQVYEFRSIQVPTAFAPGIGGNPVNDLLHVHGNTSLVEKINLFRIFNRWGEVIYETSGFKINDLNVGWDGTFKGKEVPAGVYLWYVEVKFIDGSVESYKGHTTLVR